MSNNHPFDVGSSLSLACVNLIFTVDLPNFEHHVNKGFSKPTTYKVGAPIISIEPIINHFDERRMGKGKR